MTVINVAGPEPKPAGTPCRFGGRPSSGGLDVNAPGGRGGRHAHVPCRARLVDARSTAPEVAKAVKQEDIGAISGQLTRPSDLHDRRSGLMLRVLAEFRDPAKVRARSPASSAVAPARRSRIRCN